MQNYKVSIAYDGSSFYGFQKQKNRPTVQGKIEEVLDLLIEDYDLNYSGRTDAGVHAKEQILNILTDTKITEKLISSIDKLLGNKISVNSFNQISYDFQLGTVRNNELTFTLQWIIKKNYHSYSITPTNIIQRLIWKS